MLNGRAFCRLLAVGRLLNWKFCWFWLFLCDFHFLDTFEIKEVSERAVLTHPDQLAIHILKTTTSGDDLRVTRLTCNSGVNFRNRYVCWSQWPIQLWSKFLLVWIWTFSTFIYHRISVSKGWVLSLKIKFSAFTSVEQVQDWAAIFIRRFCLLFLKVEKWVNNFKRV